MSHHCMCNYLGARLVVDKVAAVTSPENAPARLMIRYQYSCHYQTQSLYRRPVIVVPWDSFTNHGSSSATRPKLAVQRAYKCMELFNPLHIQY